MRKPLYALGFALAALILAVLLPLLSSSPNGIESALLEQHAAYVAGDYTKADRMLEEYAEGQKSVGCWVGTATGAGFNSIAQAQARADSVVSDVRTILDDGGTLESASLVDRASSGYQYFVLYRVC